MVLAPRCPRCRTQLQKLFDDVKLPKDTCFGITYTTGGWYCPKCQEVKYDKSVNF